MRRPNRDISIFSLSLMDVISGAMGAFLIIMIVLARYYEFDPEPKEDVEELREKLDAAIAGLSDIRGGTETIFEDLILSEQGATTAGLPMEETIAQIEAMTGGIATDVERVIRHLDRAHEQLNTVENEIDEKNAQLERAKDLVDELERRNPLVVSADWMCAHNVDLFVESNRRGAESDRLGAQFDPRTRSFQGFEGDSASSLDKGPGNELSMVSITSPGFTFKVFVNLRDPEPDAECRVDSHAIGFGNFFTVVGHTTLTPENSFDYLGAITVLDDYGFEYVPATPEQREEELRIVRERVANTPEPSS